MYLYFFPDRNTAVSSVSGFTAGLIAVLVAHPVETIKVRMQAQKTGYRLRDLPSLVRNPYYGLAPHLPHYGLMNILRFGAFEFAKPLFGVRPDRPPRHSQLFASGVFSGLAVAATLHPFYVVRTIQQANRISVQQSVRRLWAEEGPRGFLRCYDLNLLRLGFAFGVFFASYPAVKAALADEHGKLSYWSRSMAGGITGVLTWSSIYPLDVVQSRLAAQPIGHREFISPVKCAKAMYLEGGWRIFGRGYAAVLVRAFPVNAILLPVADLCSAFFGAHLPEGRAVWKTN